MGQRGGNLNFRPLMTGPVVACFVILALFVCPGASLAQDETEAAAPDSIPPLAAPSSLTAEDTPGDRGASVSLTWEHSPDQESGRVQLYRIYRSAEPQGDFERIARVGFAQNHYRASEAINNQELFYRVTASDGEVESPPSEVVSAVAMPQWFNPRRANAMVGTIIFVVAIVYFVNAAKKGKELFIRRLAGLDEIDNAVGRATEMGKPILYISGLSSFSDVATIAAINILGEVAKKMAEYNTRLIVPCADPIVMAVEQEVVRESYAKVGRPDAYNEDDVFYLTRSQFAYVAGVNGIMVRQRPATILYMGMFFAEALVLAETGASVGSIQIAGTDAVTQLPFFITSCDYTLIGEELYAASAYLSREPVLLGGLKGQDTVKFIIGAFVILAVVTATLAAFGVIPHDPVTPLFTTG